MENEIIVKGTQNFMGIEIPIVEGGFGENKKCILVNTVAEIHSARIDKINEMISNNIDEFETGVDIIDLMANDDSLNLAKKYKLITNNRQRHCYVLSKNGYLRKSITATLSHWQTFMRCPLTICSAGQKTGSR